MFEDWNADLEWSASGDPSGDVLSFRSRSLGREVRIEPSLVHQPGGVLTAAVSAGVKHEGVLDFGVVKLPRPGSAAALFTKNRCAAHAVNFDRATLADGRAQLLAVVSKNANVFTPHGDEDMRTLAAWLASEFGVDPGDIVLSCTGVIGVPLPMPKLERAVKGLSQRLRPQALDDMSHAILTTDHGPKVGSVRVGELVVAAIAKGAGMIEPNMATMLVYFFSNARLGPARLKEVLTDAVDRTFHSISVDSDTSTSDTVALFSTDELELTPDLESDFVDAVRCISIKLAREIVARSEGATKLIDCKVSLDSSAADAKIVAKKVVNSPLVKTAIHGGDPNWGRIVMAIGKPDERMTLGAISPADVVIELMGVTVFSRSEPMEVDLEALAGRIRASRRISVDVRIGKGQYRSRVWGCDLGRRYVEINADYTT